MHVYPVKPSHIPGGFAIFQVPEHAQEIIGIEDKQVKGKDIKRECYHKRQGGKGEKRKVLKAKPDSLNMEFAAFRKGPECLKHTRPPRRRCLNVGKVTNRVNPNLIEPTRRG
jgi:hypothetical protein